LSFVSLSIQIDHIADQCGYHNAKLQIIKY